MLDFLPAIVTGLGCVASVSVLFYRVAALEQEQHQLEKRITNVEQSISEMRETMAVVATDVRWIREELAS
jgi:chromosome segregation ATPase